MGTTIHDRIFTSFLDDDRWFHVQAEDTFADSALGFWDPRGEQPERTPQVAINAQQETIREHGEDYVFPEERLVLDPAKVEEEIRDYHSSCTIAFGSFDAPSSYFVAPDGRWHHDMVQLYAMAEGQPYLTPDEWLAKKMTTTHRSA